MTDLYINRDDAQPQAQAVLAYIRVRDGIPGSWSSEQLKYMANPQVYHWHNGRERGYVITLIGYKWEKQFNIAFFEHRNSDSICAVKWESSSTINPPTIDDISKDHPYYKSKKAEEMANWINEELDSWWKNNGKE